MCVDIFLRPSTRTSTALRLADKLGEGISEIYPRGGAFFF